MVDYKILDAWEKKYLTKLKDRDILAWSDAEAVYKYPKWKWIYDKYELHRYLQMVPTWNLWDEFPKEYPIFVKPRININGLGFGSGKVNSLFEIFDRGLCGTHIGQPILSGDHVSTDIVFDGEILVDYFSFYCRYNSRGNLVLFESTNTPPKPALIKKLSKIGEGRRVMNVETIGNKPLEVHLRPSVQFYDISGGLLEQMPNFIQTGAWRPVRQESTYSRVFRRPNDSRAARPSKIPPYPSGIRSIQFCWESQKRLSKHGQDPNSFKYLVVNGTNLRNINAYGRMLTNLITFHP